MHSFEAARSRHTSRQGMGFKIRVGIGLCQCESTITELIISNTKARFAIYVGVFCAYFLCPTSSLVYDSSNPLHIFVVGRCGCHAGFYYLLKENNIVTR